MSRPGQPPPVSFKPVPGRNRTQKWQHAKTHTYDGDDWGGLDTFDEYDGYDDPPLPPQPPIAQRSRPSVDTTAPGRFKRVNSFEQDDERRQFSAGATPVTTAPFPAYASGNTPINNEGANIAGSARGSSDMPRGRSRPRDFTNPEQAPPPLNPRASPAPAESFPPRKSSRSASGPRETSSAVAAAPVPALPTEKPLPFIRPSDIYKRIPEELERVRRQSEEGSRPSMDSLQREDTSTPPTGLGTPRTGLAPVAESRESRMFMDDEPLSSQMSTAESAPVDNGNGRYNMPSMSATTTSAGAISQNDPAVASNLHHQESQGFRSAVHLAFDRPAESTTSSQDGTLQSGSGGVSRSDTNSTASISPIMSHVQAANVAQQRLQERIDTQVPPVAEEPVPTSSRPTSAFRIPEQDSTFHASAESPVGFTPGYRRNMDPPSSGTSPARMLALDDTTTRRVSSGFTAEAVNANDTPHMVQHVDSADSSTSQITGRGRSDTDYSAREVDLANTASALPDQDHVSAVAAEAKAHQQLFINTHSHQTSTPASPWTTKGAAGSRSGTPTSGVRDSPGKGRVREIGEQYQERLKSSRRDSSASVGSSKSGPEPMQRSEENLQATSLRKGTPKLDSQAAATTDEHREIDSPDTPVALHPGLQPKLEREQSFRPDIPGGWVSAAPTPAMEEPPPSEAESVDPSLQVSGMLVAQPDEMVDLTPTTKKAPLYEQSFEGATPTEDIRNPLDVVKDAGSQLGAALMSSVGMGHQTRDFASSDAAAPVEQPEMYQPVARGYLGTQPPLRRQETDTSEAAASLNSSILSTPTQEQPHGGDVRTDTDRDVQPTDGYFTHTVAPLRFKPRQDSTESSEPAPAIQHLTDSGVDDIESERLHDEIEQSLHVTDPGDSHADAVHEDMQRTQNALDAPDNARLVEQGQPPMPGAETSASAMPGSLSKKFSWEQRMQDDPPTTHTATIGQAAPSYTAPILQPESPEVKPEAAYERPRTKALHVMNASADTGSPEEERNPLVFDNDALRSTGPNFLHVASAHPTDGGVSPISKSQQELLDSMPSKPRGESPSRSVQHLEPSPLSNQAESEDSGSRFPSYYWSNDPSGPITDADINKPTPQTPILPDSASWNNDRSAPTVESDLHKPTPGTPTIPPDSASAEATKSKAGHIPPFRTILAMKSTDERIQTYNDTRQTFAEMNTGLGEWLSSMVAKHPEHSDPSVAGPPLSVQTSGLATPTRGHKQSPSIMKLARQFTDGPRSASGNAGPDSSVSSGGLQARPSTAGNKPQFDATKMQQRGKDVMKSAGVLGGKAQAGARGLFAKGKTKFGRRESTGDKAFPILSPTDTSSTAPNTSSPNEIRQLSTSLDRMPRPTLGLRGGGASNDPTPAASPLEEKPLPPLPPPDATLPTNSSPSLPPTQHASLLKRVTSPETGVFRRAETSAHPSNRPLSQTFSRLAGLSRSKSTKTKDDNSRPTTLIIPKSNPIAHSQEVSNQEEDDTEPEETSLAIPSQDDVAVHKDEENNPIIPLSLLAGPSAEETLSGETSQRVLSPEDIGGVLSPSSTATSEVWSQPGFQLPSQSPEEHPDFLHLGVLPSPAETMKTFDFSPRKLDDTERREMEEELTAHRDDSRGRVDSAEVSPRDRAGNAGKTGSGSKRRASDFAMLPSQRQVSISTTMATPIATASHAEDAGDELYDVSPVADRAADSLPLRSVSTGEDAFTSAHNDGPEMEEVPATMAIPESASLDTPTAHPSTAVAGSTVAGPGATDVSPERPVEDETLKTAQKVDTRDMFGPATNATDDFQDARSEISAEGARRPSVPRGLTEIISRHSSVSSLGGADLTIATMGLPPPDLDADDDVPIMSAQAVPAGPFTSLSPSTRYQESRLSPEPNSRTAPPALSPNVSEQDYQQRFANRSYRQPETAMERPMSYAPLARDMTGNPVQERLLATDRRPLSVDLSNLHGPPLGAPPFQSHPAVREGSISEDTEIDIVRSSVQDTARRPNPQTGSGLGADLGGRKSKRLSGLFRRSRPSSAQKSPASSGILEGVAQPSNIQTPKEDKQNKRRSGFWESIVSTNRRMSTSTKPDSSREGSMLKLDSNVRSNSNMPRSAPPQTNDMIPRPNTLRKPQRLPSTSPPRPEPEAEPKKKRLSGLGSLFGRSKTTGHGTAKPSRLTKPQQPSKSDTVKRRAPLPDREFGNSVRGTVRGYEAYEAMRRREVPAFQENAARYHALDTRALPSREPTLPSVHHDAVTPPVDGWYSPNGDRNSEVDPMSLQQVPRPRPRRLPSDHSGRTGMAYSNVPEAFRPVPASFKRPVQPIGPPPDDRSPLHDVYDPYGESPPPLYDNQPFGRVASPPFTPFSPAVDPNQRRRPSNTSGITRQPHVTAGRMPSHSDRIPSSRGYRGALADQDMAHSPAREYPDQQTPWAIGLPREPSSVRAHNTPPYSSNSYDPYPFDTSDYANHHSARQYPPGGPPFMSSDEPQRRQLQVFTTTQQDEAHGSAQVSHEARQPAWVQTHSRGSGRTRPPQPSLPSNQAPTSGLPQRYMRNGQPPLPRLVSSGLNDRRNDQPLEEDGEQMRGASYPGQEWTPPGLSGADWD